MAAGRPSLPNPARPPSFPEQCAIPHARPNPCGKCGGVWSNGGLRFQCHDIRSCLAGRVRHRDGDHDCLGLRARNLDLGKTVTRLIRDAVGGEHPRIVRDGLGAITTAARPAMGARNESNRRRDPTVFRLRLENHARGHPVTVFASITSAATEQKKGREPQHGCERGTKGPPHARILSWAPIDWALATRRGLPRPLLECRRHPDLPRDLDPADDLLDRQADVAGRSRRPVARIVRTLAAVKVPLQ